MKKNQHQWMTIDQAAARIGCSTRTLQRRVADGTVAARRREDGRVVVRVGVPTLLQRDESCSEAKTRTHPSKVLENRVAALERATRNFSHLDILTSLCAAMSEIQRLHARVVELDRFASNLDASAKKNAVLAAMCGTGGDAAREACVPPFQNTGDRAGGESA